MTGSAAFTAALRDRSAPAPAGLVTWNGSDPGQRFSIYRNNVTVALIDALAATFPVTEALCGTAFFREMARTFALRSPPSSPLLAEFGQDFPAFVEGYAPARPAPCLAEIARLEALRALVWHAAEAVPLPPSAFAPWQDRIGDAVLTLHPAHAVLAARHAIVSIWAAHNGLGELSNVDAESPEEALIIRPELDTVIWRLPPGGGAFIRHLEGGDCVSEAAMTTLASEPAFDPVNALTLIVRSGLVTSLNSRAT